MWHGTNVSPRKKKLINSGIYTSSSTAGVAMYMLCDYLMFYPLIDFDLADEQVFLNTITLPRYPDGEGVMAFIVATGDTGVSDHAITLTYTNSQGVAGRTNPITVQCNIPSITGQVVHSGVTTGRTGPFIPLADGDSGIRSVQSIQLDSGSGAGWCCLVLCKPLVTIPITTYVFPSERSQIFQPPSIPEIKYEAFLGVLMHSGGAVAGGSRICGYHEFVW